MGWIQNASAVTSGWGVRLYASSTARVGAKCQQFIV